MIDSTFGQLSILSREEILETVEKFLSLFQHACVGMVIAAPEGQLLDVNAAFCDFLGYSREELVGQAVQRFVHPEDLAMASQKFDEARSGQHSSPRLEKRYLRKDGTIRWAEVTASTVRDAAGELRCFIVQVLDITERKRGEEALRASEAAKGAILRSLKSAIAVVRPDGEHRVGNVRAREWRKRSDKYGRRTELSGDLPASEQNGLPGGRAGMSGR